MAEAEGETATKSPCMNFREALGPKVLNQGMKTFDNNLFIQNSETVDAGPSNGSRIAKTNGCLERCKERPKLVVPVEMIADDVEYYSHHSLYCKFLGMRASMQFLEAWTWRLGSRKGKWR